MDRFAAYIAHELRAPITLQLALTEAALTDPRADEVTLRAMGENVVASCEQQQRLIESLLDLTHCRRGVSHQEPVDLAALTREALRAHESNDLERVVALAPAVVTGDPILLERLVANLVSNATQHNVPGGRIELATGTDGNRALISVANSGPVIPAGELARLFQPFERLRGDDAIGAGLGLAIVGSIADAHDSIIDARPRPGGGLEIEVSFIRAMTPHLVNVSARQHPLGDGCGHNVRAMPNASRIAHAGLPFANPMSEAAVDAAVRSLALPSEPFVLDTGCGVGEILLRVLQRHPDARGLGVDLDPDAIAEARHRATGLPARFEIRDAATVEGAFDAVINVGSSHALGGFPAVLKALRALGRTALYGEGFWQRAPSEEFLAALGGARTDELSDLDGLRAAVTEAGFDITREWLASEDDWARYEETLAANAERHDTPDTLAYARRIRHRRALPGSADTLGFALFVLRA